MVGVKKIKGDEERLQRREKGEKMVVRFVGRREAVGEGECCVCVCVYVLACIHGYMQMKCMVNCFLSIPHIRVFAIQTYWLKRNCLV